LRVRGFTIDDSHIFVTPEEVEGEVQRVFDLAFEFLRHFGFKEFALYLSTRPEKYVGNPEDWERAEQSLRRALERGGMIYTMDAGGGAFYGPKIDLKVKDCLGREWQCSTIQFDFNNPERFDLVYTDRENRQRRPYMVHRALMGSVERFIGVLIEHYGGDFPLWLAPVQAAVLTVGDGDKDAAASLQKRLTRAGFRVEVDCSNQRISYKIREWTMQKVPYLLVVGPKEVENGTVAVRKRGAGDVGASAVDAFMELLSREVEQNA
jgi:threonyl-tRNA synthetase